MKKFPEWIRVRCRLNSEFVRTQQILRELRLNTVCEESKCPNIFKCWGEGKPTFLLLGKLCTRTCKFCNISYWSKGSPVMEDEPERVVEAVERLGIKYVILTSVTRDDLRDQGVGIYARTVELLKERIPSVMVEVLIPDFDLRRDLIVALLESEPDVVGHNVETVKRLTPQIRDPRFEYSDSLGVLKLIKRLSPNTVVKSGLMVGLGEKKEEVFETLKDLRECGVDVVVVGQYLQPSPYHYPVVRFVPPEEFEDYEKYARELGFPLVSSEPMARSSYRAEEAAALIERVRKQTLALKSLVKGEKGA